MGNVNEVTILGRVGKDPEIKAVGDSQVASFSVATGEKWTDKQGKKQEKTEWHNIVVWGKGAEIVGKYVTKGKEICVRGKLTYRSWDKDDGSKGYRTEIVAHPFGGIQLIGGGGAGGGRDDSDPGPQPDSDESPL